MLGNIFILGDSYSTFDNHIPEGYASYYGEDGPNYIKAYPEMEFNDNPCEGPGYRQTFKGQSTYIFSVNNKDYLMLDHWIPKDLKSSGYSILPIKYDEDNNITVTWEDEWKGI